MPQNSTTNSDLHRAVTILEEAQRGRASARLDDAPKDALLARLYGAINALLEGFEQERKRSIARRNEIEDLLATIELQQATILESATPVIEVAEGVLCLPVNGSIDETQGNTILDTLLGTIVARRAREIILDVTGVRMMGAATGRWLTNVASAVRLLGAECTITGIQPELARLLAASSLELLGVHTVASVRDALERRLAREGAASKNPTSIKTLR